jgi:hypothetical protein
MKDCRVREHVYEENAFRVESQLKNAVIFAP